MADDEAPAFVEEVRERVDEGDLYTAERAGRELEEWARGADLEQVRPLLRDPRNEVSRAAARALAARGDAGAIPALVYEASLVKRCEAARWARDAQAYQHSESGDLGHGDHPRALVELGERAAVPHLVEALDRVSNPWVKWELVWVLGELGDPEALPAVEEVLEEFREEEGSGWTYEDRVKTAARAAGKLRRGGEG